MQQCLDKAIEGFYEDVEPANTKVNAQYTIMMRDLNVKVGRKQVGESTV